MTCSGTATSRAASSVAGDGAKGLDAPAPLPSSRKAPTVNELVEAMQGMSIALGFDELAGEPRKTGPLPWDPSGEARGWSDLDDAELFARLQDAVGLKSDRDLGRAVTIYAHHESYDPLIDMLDGLVWDGVHRVGTLAGRYLGVIADDYARAVETLLFCGGISRAYQPGGKYDYVPALVGPGGVGKSTFVRRLALEERYFTDSVSDLGDVKATGEILRGKWIVELSELTGITGRSLEAVKAGVTRQADTYRAAYARRSSDYPRRSIFVATTNTIGFIAERSSGARRFLPIICGREAPKASVFSQGFTRDVRQAWAEARDWRSAGDPRYSLHLSPEMEAEASRRREECLEEDPRLDLVRQYLSANRGRRICTRELADRALGREATTKLCRDLSAMLNGQCPGWRYAGKLQCGAYKKQNCWVYLP